MRSFLFPLFFFVVLMTTAQNGPLEVPEIGIRIPIGETVVVQGVSLSFVEVLEDSRCPEDVTCVWAGRARIAVRVKAPGREPESKMLIFGDISRFKRIKFACLNFNLAHLGLKLTHLSFNLNSFSLISAHVILKPISFTPKNAPLLLLKPFQVSLKPCQLSSKPFSLPLRPIELLICNKHDPLISFL